MSDAIEKYITQLLADKSRHAELLLIGLTACAAIAWVYISSQTVMSSEMGWLLQCLNRFVAGESYAADLYTPHAPLSFWIYVPAYPLYQYLGFTPYFALKALVLVYIAIASWACHTMLRATPLLRRDRVFALCAFVLSVTWGAGYDFATAHHIIMIGLAPFLCYQASPLSSQKPSSLARIVSIMGGGIAICLQPAVAVIAVGMIILRIIATRRIIRHLTRADLWGVLIAIGVYVGALYALTPQYIADMIANIDHNHIAQRSAGYWAHLTYIIYACVAVGFVFYTAKTVKHSTDSEGRFDASSAKLIYILAFISILCAIPYLSSTEGLRVQAVPLIGFSIITLLAGLAVIMRAHNILGDIFHPPLLVVACLMMSFGWTVGSPHRYMNTQQLLNTPLIEAIQSHASDHSYASLDLTHQHMQLPFISDLDNGLELGSLWFIKELNTLRNTANTAEKREYYSTLIHTHIDALANDLAARTPSVLVIPRYIDVKTSKPSDSYLSFLRENETFNTLFTQYRYVDTYPFNTKLRRQAAGDGDITYYGVYALAHSQH